MWIGGTMTVPGVSGGSMAMILGVYDRLISSVSSFFKNPGKSMSFLVRFVLGAGVGMVLFSRFISFLFTTRADVPLRFFFLGAVAGGIPLICRQAQVKKITWQALLWPLAGLLMVYGLAALPEGLFTAGLPGAASSPGVPSFRALLFQFLGGCILAVALILPGISVSQMLLMLGLYEPVMEAVSSLRFASLLPLGLGAVLCTLLVTRLLGSAMQRRPQPTYLLILGFVLGSLGELYPGLPEGWNLLFAPLAAVAGYQLLSRLSRRAE